MDFIWHEFIHLIVSLGIGLGLFLVHRHRKTVSSGWSIMVVAFLFGVCIDIDHWIDYFLYFGARVNMADFLNVTKYMLSSQKVYVLFHGWEFTPFLYLLGSYVGKKIRVGELPLAIVLAYTAHLVIDTVNVGHSPLVYSLLFRLLNQFNLEVFL